MKKSNSTAPFRWPLAFPAGGSINASALTAHFSSLLGTSYSLLNFIYLLLALNVDHTLSDPGSVCMTAYAQSGVGGALDFHGRLVLVSIHGFAPGPGV